MPFPSTLSIICPSAHCEYFDRLVKHGISFWVFVVRLRMRDCEVNPESDWLCGCTPMRMPKGEVEVEVAVGSRHGDACLTVHRRTLSWMNKVVHNPVAE
jgi:hypothetical protein